MSANFIGGIAMAITSNFKFTNNTSTTSKAVTLYDMKELHSYALKEDEPNSCILDNKTAPSESSEIIWFRGKQIDHVNTKLSLPENSLKLSKGVQYAIQVENDWVSEDASVAFRQDDPIVAYLTIIHPNSQYVTDAAIGKTVNRLISECQTEDGEWRFSDLRRLALKPTVE